MGKDLLEELQGKVSFIYELNNKLYAIGHSKVFDCTYSKVIAPNLKKLFSIYKSNIKSTNEELYKNEIAKIMYRLASYSNIEVKTKDNNEHIISIEEFLNNLTNEEKELIKKQVDDFGSMFKKTNMATLYPSVRHT